MSQQLKRLPSGGPHAMLDDEQYAEWQKANNEAFDKLPPSIKDAIRETGIDMDHTKLLHCLEIGIPELTIICAIYERDRASKDPAPSILRPDRRGNVRLH